MKSSPSAPRHLDYTVAALLAALVVTMWAPFGPGRGMPYETTFAQWSETQSFWSGFLFVGDPLRPHTNTFYHFSYVLSQALGIPGSFATFEWVYALLWWGRGFLVYLILVEFLPGHRLVCAAAGALVVSHAADGSLQWVGQMNQCGVMVWMLLAFYTGLLFLRVANRFAASLLFLGIIFFLHMALWSYEAELPILMVLPLALFILRDRGLARRIAFAAGWYLVAAVYIGQTAFRYLGQTDAAYQQSVLRSGGIKLATLLSDWHFNIWEGVRFWSWTATTPRPEQIAAHLPVLWTVGQIVTLGILGAVLWLGWMWWARSRTSVPAARSTFLALFGIGLTVYCLSFPVFLLLGSARGLWRTQLMSGLGYGVALAALGAFLVSWIGNPRLRLAVFALLCAVPLGYGVRAAVNRGGFHYGIWERHRFAVAQVLAIAPAVEPGAVVFLTNVPSQPSPFGDNMWYLVALQLAYPRCYIAGAYLHPDGSRPPGYNLKLEGREWVWSGTGWPPAEPRRFPFEKTIAIQFSPDGKPTLLDQLPAALEIPPELNASYAPRTVIHSRPGFDYGLRRYLRGEHLR
ncbi:MAG: hypothetical protein HYV96_17010 [Opitutae bacterium]|nr:hypothetical protein [Opitutae bacterium]